MTWLAGLLILAAVTSPTPLLPNSALTPGVAATDSVEAVCALGYSGKHRHVTLATKEHVYAIYHITKHKLGDYEIDHLIPLELGGSNDIPNLWPQSYKTQPWNAFKKDRLENHLRRLVCAQRLPLPVAQGMITQNWIEAYKFFLGRETGPAGAR